ncbi:TlpA family protein disulfide reductase [Flavobacterium azooxidireducens]|uniref:TlpA family protein disulfide reductase n=1 Tax=Flavobacterium azooxidireducens TaxID=1871076 RepID=A0ABY4KES2_9FLAO|nr:TlpA disulfide reductase family protein [Flavobacterium azooxidireducens]UPQ79049.1 TlpA family protein disulfide reductase [Flavobacterium azooxidireducens]
MKKIIALLSVICFISCQDKEVITTLSGKIANAESKTIKLEGLNFSKEINLNEDGTFSDTLQLDYDGLYSLVLNDEKQRFIYLENGFQLNIENNAEEFEKSFTFKGSGSDENNFMSKKHQVIESIYGKMNDMEGVKPLFTLDEKAFIEKNELYKKEILKTLDEAKLTNQNFVKLEKLDADYHVLKLYEQYPSYHGYFTDNREFKASESFPKVGTDFSLDNEELFKFSNSYRNLSGSHFSEKMYSEADSTKTPIEKGFATLKTIKSKLIQSEMVKNMMYELNGTTPNLEAVYKEMLSYSIDEKYKDKLTEKFEILKGIAKGLPSPTFDYENINGGKTSLESLKGKFVYIDVWATWCGPCIREIPALKEVEKEYHGKNIEFVSISIDDQKDLEKWKKMVADKELKGIQLFADNAWESDFVKKYAIDGIPRFILLDTEGKIINSDAPRPSDAKLKELLKEVGL